MEALLVDCFLRLALSIVAGVILGLERKIRQRVMGMRTLVLICVSSCLMTLISIYCANYPGSVTGDPTRIAASIVSGVGFLGGGAILHRGMNVHGLTSAAIIWTASAVGMAIGVGMLVQAGFTLAVCLTTLVIFERVELKFFPAEKNRILKIEFAENSVEISELKRIILDCGFVISDVGMKKDFAARRIGFTFTVKSMNGADEQNLLKNFAQIPSIQELSFES